jgi:hypothetical protein
MNDEKTLAKRPVMLLVLGPHRSGTSLTARMLECLGAENSRNQIPPQQDNPKGFFEDADIYHFNEAILLPRLRQHWAHSHSVDWSSLSKTERSRLGLQALEMLRRNYPLSKRLSVLKEPRINNTLPFWLSLMEHAGFDVRAVCVVRDPVSVARSLQARNGFSITRAGMVYLSAWLSVLPHLQDRNTAFVHYDEIFASPGKSLLTVARALTLPLPEDFEQRVHEFSSSHLDPGMRHSAVHRDDVQLEPELLPPVIDLYRTLLDAAQSQNVKKTVKFLSRAESFLANIAPLLADYDAASTASDAARSELGTLHHQQAQLQEQLAAAHQSENSDLATRHSSLVTESEDIRSAHSSISTLYSSLVAERDELATRHSALDSRLSTLTAEHSDLVTRHMSLVTSHDDLATRLAATEASKQELALLQSDLADRHRALVEQQLSTEADRDRMFAEREELLRQLTSLDANHSGLLTELRSQSASLAAERDSLLDRCADLETEHFSLSTLRSTLIAERDDVAARLSSLEDELATLSAATAAEREAKTKVEAQLSDVTEENNLLLAQLHQAQEALEKYLLENQALKQESDRARSLATQLQALRFDHSSLVAERDELVAALDDHCSQQSQLESDRISLIAGHEALEHDLQSTRNDKKALEENVAARFNELAILAKTIAEKDDTLQRLKQAASYRGANGCLIEKISFADAREYPPHNHLNITLHSLQAGDTYWDTLRIRLVEHHGRPGLAIFEPPSGGAPLKKWSHSGEESRVPFYLLVPEDSNGRRLLDEAAGADFYFLQFAVGALEAELLKSSASPDLPPGRVATLQAWLQRATSLRQIFDRQSRVFFRHGQPRTQLSPEEGTAKAVQVTLPDCCFDGRFFPIVEFTWKPEDSTLLFSAKGNSIPLFVGTEPLRHWSAGSSLEVCFEGNPKAADSVHKIPSTENDARLAKAIAQKLPALLPTLPASFQRKARALTRSFLGETKVAFRRPAKSSRS